MGKSGMTEKGIMTGVHGAGYPVPTVLLKTISMAFIACGLIFKGLISSFRLVTGYSAITLEE